jgi:hypothetical protein
MPVDLHEMLGRRYEFADRSAPDVTLVGVDPKRKLVRLHALDGQRQTLPLPMFLSAVTRGALVESMLPSFVWDTPAEATAASIRYRDNLGLRDPRDKHKDSAGVAGRGKRIIPHSEMLKGTHGSSGTRD